MQDPHVHRHQCRNEPEPGTDWAKVLPKTLSMAQHLAQHSWEYATAAHATSEYYNPDLSVFGPFVPSSEKDLWPYRPSMQMPPASETIPALEFIRPHIWLHSPELHPSPHTIGDPPSLIPFALLLSNHDGRYADAIERQIITLHKTAPRFQVHDGQFVLSHWRAQPELWSDNIFMAPPSLAAYALSADSDVWMELSLSSITGHRKVLSITADDEMKENLPQSEGLWRHIVVAKDADQKNQDPGAWTTGNGWVGLGMCHTWARYLNQIMHKKAKGDNSGRQHVLVNIECVADMIANLFGGLKKRVQYNQENYGLEEQECSLLPNYLTDPTYFKDCAGTAALAAAIFRYALLAKTTTEMFPGILAISQHVEFCRTLFLPMGERLRNAVLAHIDTRTGVAAPMCWPLDHYSRTPCYSGSSEGLGFVVLMQTAWRDLNTVKTRLAVMGRSY